MGARGNPNPLIKPSALRRTVSAGAAGLAIFAGSCLGIGTAAASEPLVLRDVVGVAVDADDPDTFALGPRDREKRSLQSQWIVVGGVIVVMFALVLAVTATGIALMRHKVLASFADYAVEIELERLTTAATGRGVPAGRVQ